MDMNIGLEGVVACETVLSDVRGEEGVLVIRGRSVEAMSQLSFAEVCEAMWGDTSGDALGRARQSAFEALDRSLLSLGAMDCLRASVARLPSESTATAITATVGVVTSAWGRNHRGGALLAPDGAASHGADLLRMLGVPGDDAHAHALERYLATVVDHGMNASTFAARVVASTGSDLVSAVTAALGALKGPLHGGAPGPVLDMLDAVGESGDAEGWVAAELAAGRRIMGMGHRVYRTRDPRAAVLETVAEALGSPRLPLARRVEAAARAALQARHPDRPLHANVEFATALVLEALGIPRELFTAVFACSRVVGWCAHVEEQRATGRLIRPRSRYIGPSSESTVLAR